LHQRRPALLHLLADALQRLRSEFGCLRKCVRFLFVDVHLHRLREHLELRVVALVGRTHTAKLLDKHLRDVVFFFRFVDQVSRVALAPDRGVEDLLFELGVDRQFGESLLDEALLHLPVFGVFELTEDVFHPSVVFAQDL